jgi:hypothetical protein
MLARAAAWIAAAFVVPSERCPGPWFARDAASCRRARGRCDCEQRDGGRAGRVIEGLAQLGKAQIDQTQDAVAEAGLLFDQAHREARGLAQLGAGQWLRGPRSVDHAQSGEGTRVSGVALGALQPTFGEVLGGERVHHRDRVTRHTEMARQGLPIVAAGLEHDPLDRALACDPAVELSEPRPRYGDPQHLALRVDVALAADGHAVLCCADVDAEAVHASSSSVYLTPGDLAGSGPRALTFDHRSTSRGRRRVPITVPDGRRGPETSLNGHEVVAPDSAPSGLPAWVP